MIITVPLPPSVNQAYATNWKTKRRFKSKPYSDWLAHCEFLVLNQGVVFTPGRVKVEYICGKPDKRRRDLGNLEKPLSDMLVKCGLIEDDCKIDEIVMKWTDHINGVRVTVEAV